MVMVIHLGDTATLFTTHFMILFGDTMHGTLGILGIDLAMDTALVMEATAWVMLMVIITDFTMATTEAVLLEAAAAAKATVVFVE